MLKLCRGEWFKLECNQPLRASLEGETIVRLENILTFCLPSFLFALHALYLTVLGLL